MRRFLAAFRFLTVFPVPGTLGTGEADLAGCVAFIPLVGVVLGAIAGAAAWALGQVAPPLVGAVIIVLLLLKMSGGLHLDGLADTADGFYGTRGKQRILEIMKDSRIGAMGAMAVGDCLLTKFAALASVNPAALWKVAALTPVIGRCLIVLQMALLPYARSEGLGLIFYRRRHRFDAAWSLLLLAGCGYLTLGRPGLIAAAFAILAGLLFCIQCRQKIGGATGDTFGAICEVGETAWLLAIAMTLYQTNH